MKEISQILDVLEGDPRGVLATVVQVKGSSYRRPGARMLIRPDGSRIGSVSGGCLEGDLVRKARWLTEEGPPLLRTYDTTSDEEAVYEYGLGCNGVIDVLLERVNPAFMDYLRLARRARQTAISATVLRGGPAGSRQWLNPDGTVSGDPIPGLTLVPTARTQVVHIGATEVFLERLDPPPFLVLFGAGIDTVPLANIARELGWQVKVADGRPALADAASTIRQLAIPEHSAVVLMTHSYPQDRALLPSLLSLPLLYLGLLGPKSRTDRLFEELRLSAPAHLHAPVGLDIGAGSPETIALAIASEIAATLAGRTGQPLKDRQAPIYDHQLVPDVIVSNA